MSDHQSRREFFELGASALLGGTLTETLGAGRVAGSSARLTPEPDLIVFGATVSLLDDEDKPIRYQIVGQTEADARTGRISYNSPLGRALIGRKVDEEVEVTVPSGDRYYLVSRIEFI